MRGLEERLRDYQPFFGRWYLKDNMELLGRGSFGAVYGIHDGPLEAALKIIPIPYGEKALIKLQKEYGEDEARRILRRDLQAAQDEIAIMRRIWSESNIVCFEESVIIEREDTYGWDILIRMEKLVRVDHYLEGRGSRTPPKRDTRLIVHLWDDLLSGLVVCEHNRIVHLDIKPDNVYYAPGRDHFKLGDFGEAVRRESGRNVAENKMVGTLYYMAPEVYNKRGADHRSDIYSLAMTVYQLFNNDRIPFMPTAGAVTADDWARAMKIRLEEHRPIPRLKGVDPNLMNILLRCLEYDPDRRYQQVRDVQNDLRALIYNGSLNLQKEGKHKSKLVPLLITLASLGLVGVMAVLGVRLLGSGDSPEPVAANVQPQPSPSATEPQTGGLMGILNVFEEDLLSSNSTAATPSEP